MLARVHDESIMDTAAKVDDFFPPFFNEGGRKLTEGGEDERLVKKHLVYIDLEYYARLCFI